MAALHERRAAARAARGRPAEAMVDVDAAVTLAPRFVPARLLRAKLRGAVGRNEEAFLDLRAVHAAAPHTEGIVELMSEAAKAALRDEQGMKKERTRQDVMAGDYYDLLGVEMDAPVDAIRKAYRRLARTLHPDKTARLTEDKRSEAEDMFKRIAKAYETLVDADERAAYDRSCR